ncbi:hypothetical protein WG66_000075 [Moniliophthora roreri]|uniref:Uncharacterized protein n=1 Tax=Moniliophthora roreri TaxID=221103 RepID=A0A0W0FWE3_MONRR|nr:hypothetical protein WG66_000075 [Moniliophthora roreri]
MAMSIVDDAMTRLQPFLLKLRSLEAIDTTGDGAELTPVLDEVKSILSDATLKVKALVGTAVGTSGEVSVDNVASNIVLLINVVLSRLDSMYSVNDLRVKVSTSLLVGVASTLGDLLHSLTSLVGDELIPTVLLMISGVVSHPGCASDFNLLGVDVHALAGKSVGSL